MSGKHTPTPWSWHKAQLDDEGIWVGSDSSNVCFIPGYNDHPHNQANAAFIVQAVNSYDSNRATIEALVGALLPFSKISLAHTDDLDDSALILDFDGGSIQLGHLRAVHAALRLARGGA